MRIRVETLGNLLISSGKKLEPFEWDYVSINNNNTKTYKIVFFDLDKWFDDILKYENNKEIFDFISELFVKTVHKKNRLDIGFKKLVQEVNEKFKIRLNCYDYKKRVFDINFQKDLEFEKKYKRANITLFFNNGEMYFIPGSSVKGVFRTVLEFSNRESMLDEFIFRDSLSDLSGLMRVVKNRNFMGKRSSLELEQVICKGKKFFLNIVLKENLGNVDKERDKFIELFNYVKSFSTKLINSEIKIIESKASKEDNPYLKKDYDKVIENLKKLNKNLNELKDNECIVKLGKHTGWLSKSSLILRKWNSNNFDDLRSLRREMVIRNRKKYNPKRFGLGVKALTVDYNTMEPYGWVKLSLVDENEEK